MTHQNWRCEPGNQPIISGLLQQIGALATIMENQSDFEVDGPEIANQNGYFYNQNFIYDIQP